MIALLASLMLSVGLQVGDTWTSERTCHFIQEAEHIDVKSVDKSVYTVVRSDAERLMISCETVSNQPGVAKPPKRIVAFSPSGALLGREDSVDSNIGRLNRMEWTATEARQGISWSRNWPASANLLEAKVLVKPIARTPKATTMFVTYSEGKEIKCSATMNVLNEVRIVESVTASYSNVLVPGSPKLGKLEISEKLKEVHLVGL